MRLENYMITNYPSAADRMKTLQCGCMELVHEECPHLQPVPCMAIKGRVIRPAFGRASYLHNLALRLGSHNQAWALNTETLAIVT
jgi:hypothetical protein